MKIRVNDMIGCVWTIAMVDVGKTVFVCCRADPEHTILTLTPGVEFREWMMHVFEPSVIQKITDMMGFSTTDDAVLHNLYNLYVKYLQWRNDANRCGDKKLADQLMEKAKRTSEEMANIEKEIERGNNEM